MASFARGVPSLLAHAHPAPLPAFRAAFAAAHPAPTAFQSTAAAAARARLFSSSSTRAALPPRSHPHASLFDAVRANLATRSASAVQKRGVASGAYSSSSSSYGQQAGGVDWGKIGVNVGLGVAGAAGLHLLLNGETKPLEAHEWDYLRATMKYTAGGIAITAGTAFAAFRNGVTYRLMAMNPWAVAGISLVGGIGSMMAVFYTAPDSPAHYAAWAAFSAMQGLTLSPLFFVAPAILGRAGLYTLGATAGISYVGSTAKSDQYLWIGGPLLAGLGVLICTSLAPLILPASTSLRTLTMLESVSAYGGVAVFSGMILYDTNKIRRHANLSKTGALPADPVRESVSLILDIINLFTSIVRVLLLQQGGGRRR
ncbi:hypothetical protein JCM8202_006405 [Rhodotorula sphaerocarpa]